MTLPVDHLMAIQSALECGNKVAIDYRPKDQREASRKGFVVAIHPESCSVSIALEEQNAD